jgi:hypothetical protein
MTGAVGVAFTSFCAAFFISSTDYYLSSGTGSAFYLKPLAAFKKLFSSFSESSSNNFCSSII